MRVRGQVPESAAVLVLQRTALHDKPVGLSLDKVVHVQRGYFTLYRCAICVHTNLNKNAYKGGGLLGRTRQFVPCPFLQVVFQYLILQ